MVVLNDNICFSMKKLRSYLSSDVRNFVCRALEYYLNDEKINKIAKDTENYIKDKLLDDYFIYLTMDDNLCTYKYRRGKKDGNYCCKKITKNGNKKKFVCTKHNPDHIPTKKAKNAKNAKNAKIYNDGIINTIPGDNKVNLCKKTNKKIFKNRFKNKYKFKNKIKIHGEINFKYIIEKLLT